MKASLEQQQSLIDLARIDGELGKLRHRLGTLPIYDELRAAEEQLASHEVATKRRAARREPLEQALADAETKVEQLSSAIDRKQQQLDSGEGVDSRQLLVLQTEIDGFKETRDGVEMEQLDAMEQLETVEADAVSDEQTRVKLDEARHALQQRRDGEVAEFEAEIAGVVANRATCAANIPPALVEAYEESRGMGGSGVVVMKSDGTVDGGMDLSVIEIEAIKVLPIDEVYLTEDTGAVVVREQG